MKTPDYIIIGAPKCGTTALFNYLGKHPDVYKPNRKEINYFSRGYNRKTWEWYQNWFTSDPTKIQGEATPKYIYDFRSIELIKKHLPRVKLILLLRDPVERAYSNYRWTWKTDQTKVNQLGKAKDWSFEQVLQNELDTFHKNWPQG